MAASQATEALGELSWREGDSNYSYLTAGSMKGLTPGGKTLWTDRGSLSQPFTLMQLQVSCEVG